MTTTAHTIFFEKQRLDRLKAENLVKSGLIGMQDGELFLEYTQTENLLFEDGSMKTAKFDINQGFGLRGVVGDRQGYAHSAEISEFALQKACQTTQAVRQGYEGTMALKLEKANHNLYTAENPLELVSFDEKVRLLENINAYARDLENSVSQVSISFAGKWQVIGLLRPDGQWMEDIRPIVGLYVTVVTKKGNRLEFGRHGGGGRMTYGKFLKEDNWKHYVHEALRQSLLNQEAVPAPAGVMSVVLAPGEPGTLLHEAVGHGLEGDFNRKALSVFSNKIGKRVASSCVTVIDDGTIKNRRGTLNFDDEGSPTDRNILIENGILKGYMQDRLNARLMGLNVTGNCRRESYASLPMPRMTNTFMANGSYDPEEIIASVDKGLYAVDFSGGQVDIVNGNFVFSTTEAYLIENGKITAPVKGATLVGNGPDVMTKVRMVGNDLALDPGWGMCGKNGQAVPVSVGQPTVLVEGMTVGGTQI